MRFFPTLLTVSLSLVLLNCKTHKSEEQKEAASKIQAQTLSKAASDLLNSCEGGGVGALTSQVCTAVSVFTDTKAVEAFVAEVKPSDIQQAAESITSELNDQVSTNTSESSTGVASEVSTDTQAPNSEPAPSSPLQKSGLTQTQIWGIVFVGLGVAGIAAGGIAWKSRPSKSVTIEWKENEHQAPKIAQSQELNQLRREFKAWVDAGRAEGAKYNGTEFVDLLGGNKVSKLKPQEKLIFYAAVVLELGNDSTLLEKLRADLGENFSKACIQADQIIRNANTKIEENQKFLRDIGVDLLSAVEALKDRNSVLRPEKIRSYRNFQERVIAITRPLESPLRPPESSPVDVKHNLQSKSNPSGKSRGVVIGLAILAGLSGAAAGTAMIKAGLAEGTDNTPLLIFLNRVGQVAEEIRNSQ